MIWRSNLDESRRALFSDDAAYRYLLLICWDDTKPRMSSIGLNPSTADEFKNDPTVARECKRADALGFGSLLKLNLFALKATMPKEMLAAQDPVGEWPAVYDIAVAIRKWRAEDMAIATWGNHGSYGNRSKDFRICANYCGLKLWAYEVNGSGEPCHPLYKPYSLQPNRLETVSR